jgi:hypothetical protein
MSNSETQCGWFVMLLGADRETLCYRCAACTVFSMGHERVWCCNAWKEKPKQGFWGDKLPRVPMSRPQGLMTLPGNDCTATD